ncbi:MAG: DEAD/DEAH box helicase [Bacteroidetes bacterium]|jgi:SNF2 family DNA or RNA helicase|nr:DEAD/DEAH box helicase [Bacteroidota bacterium]
MEKTLEQHISEILDLLSKDENTKSDYQKAVSIYEFGAVQKLSQGEDFFEILVADGKKDFKISYDLNEKLAGDCGCKSKNWCKHRIAGLLLIQQVLETPIDLPQEGKVYTKEGMVRRVLNERKQRAKKSKYNIRYSTNIHGEHLLFNEKSERYKITIRDLENQIGYCSCKDFQTNKLGTCKHLFYIFDDIKSQKKQKFSKQEFPFIDVFCDPINDNRITYFYPKALPKEEAKLINAYFGKSKFLTKSKEKTFLNFIKEAVEFKKIIIRTEVLDKMENIYDQELLRYKKENTVLDFSSIKAELYPYQKEGIEFSTFRKGAIIADEMGLGKTLQAIGTAVFKKEIFGFQKTLIICPASLKSQWKKEIEKFTSEKAVIAEGNAFQRENIYLQNDTYFTIINYETVLRDRLEIDRGNFDFIILDEAQRIKNYETITANAIKKLKRNHSLVITGTPIENKLVDLYSIVGFTDPHLLSPLWEFSYQHCYFAKNDTDKITGYYNLQELKEKLKPILLRRVKSEVIDQLNKVSQKNIFVEMHPQQQEYHASYAQAIGRILTKKIKTPFDMQKLGMLLQNMRMVCNSTFLVDKETHFSPKLQMLEEILFDQLDLKNNDRKILIFSEWTTMNQIIGKFLVENGIGYTELNGKVPVPKRKFIIQEFEENPKCRVFLSTEAGGAGLNLQMADTVINFELPWNPAKKNQRIGRIDRLGQKNTNLTVINLITQDSIELKIASGIAVKQDLFDNVLNEKNTEDFVDFSEKGRAQFLQQLQDAIAGFDQSYNDENPIENKVEENVLIFEEEEKEEQKAEKIATKERIKKIEEMETVMNKGMEFLSGLFKMSTGNELTSKDNKIEIDHETGEVVMRFKIDF